MQKRLLPHLAAVLIFSLLTVVYFLPYFQGMTLNQGDVSQWEGASKEIADWNKAHPDDPALWTDAMFGGMPTVQISLAFPGNYVTKVYNLIGIPFPYSSSYMFMMFIGFYIFLLCLDVNPWLAIVGAIAYGLSSFTLISIEAGHNTKVQAMCLMAPVIGGVILTYRKNILLGAAVTALFSSMIISANHPQIVYYLLITLVCLGAYYFITDVLEKRLVHFFKASAVLVVAAVLAVLPNIASLWSTQDYVKETMRGGATELTEKKQQAKGGGLDFTYATEWSYGLWDGEILSLLIPDIKGGSSGGELSEESATYKELTGKGVPENSAKGFIQRAPLYWGAQQFTSGPVYFGAAVMFLFLLSMLIVRNRIKWALLSLVIISVILAVGRNTFFYHLLFDYLPYFNKFRNPSMALAIAQLAVPTIALLGLNELLTGNRKKEDLIKNLKIAGGVTAGVVLVFGLLGSFFYSFAADGDKHWYDNNQGWILDALKKDRASLLFWSSLRSLFFIGAAFGLVWFYVQKKLSNTILIGGLGLLFLVDGWMIDKRYLNADNFVEVSKYQSTHTATQADQDILRDTDPHYRVFNITQNPFNDAMTSYFHQSVGGYSAVKLQRYQDLIENQISKNNTAVLQMLNTKYVITEGQDKQPRAQRFPGLGNAWFVKEIKWAKNADEEMAGLTNFDPKNTAVVDERYKKDVPDNAIGNDSAALIKLKEYTPNKVSYFYNANTSQVAVFSEIYYDGNKGWNSYLDGKLVLHFRADYVLRAMALPAGSHQIEFKFEPKSVVLGNKIAYAGSFLLFAFVLSTLGFAGYRKLKEIEAEPQPEPKTVVTTTAAAKTGKKK